MRLSGEIYLGSFSKFLACNNAIFLGAASDQVLKRMLCYITGLVNFWRTSTACSLCLALAPTAEHTHDCAKQNVSLTSDSVCITGYVGECLHSLYSCSSAQHSQGRPGMTRAHPGALPTVIKYNRAGKAHSEHV